MIKYVGRILNNRLSDNVKKLETYIHLFLMNYATKLPAFYIGLIRPIIFFNDFNFYIFNIQHCQSQWH